MKNLLGHEVHTGDFPPIAAAIVGKRNPVLLTLDEDGQLWLLATGEHKDLVRFCLERGVRVYAELGLFVDDLRRGFAIGLLSSMARRYGRPWSGWAASTTCTPVKNRPRIAASAEGAT